EALDEATSAAAAAGLELIPGIELSAEYEDASLHVLAYWVDVEDADLLAELRRLTDSRLRRGELMIEKLQELGYAISFERVRQIASGPGEAEQIFALAGRAGLGATGAADLSGAR